jgi:hypothetical protein
LANQWISTDSALNRFVENFFTRLPWLCPFVQYTSLAKGGTTKKAGSRDGAVECHQTHAEIERLLDATDNLERISVGI